MSRPEPHLAHAYRVLADAALTIGALTLAVAVALPIAGTGTPLPLLATTAIAGLVAIAATVQRTRYRQDPAPRADNASPNQP